MNVQRFVEDRVVDREKWYKWSSVDKKLNSTSGLIPPDDRFRYGPMKNAGNLISREPTRSSGDHPLDSIVHTLYCICSRSVSRLMHTCSCPERSVRWLEGGRRQVGQTLDKWSENSRLLIRRCIKYVRANGSPVLKVHRRCMLCLEPVPSTGNMFLGINMFVGLATLYYAPVYLATFLFISRTLMVYWAGFQTFPNVR